jgi:thiol-disulfide isomerase/thioredoxin
MMTKKTLAACAIVAFTFTALGAYVANTGPDREPQQGARPAAAAPAFGPVQALYAQVLPNADGKQQALAQWQGKALLVNFWAPWCAPCVEEMPELSSLQQQYSGKNLQIIGIGIDSQAKIAQFAAKLKIAYPLYVAGMDGSELARKFGNTSGGLPYTVLIGPDGQVRKTYLGRLKFEQLRSDLSAL